MGGAEELNKAEIGFESKTFCLRDGKVGVDTPPPVLAVLCYLITCKVTFTAGLGKGSYCFNLIFIMFYLLFHWNLSFNCF